MIKEYTVLVALATFIVLFLDLIMKTNVFFRKTFWIFWGLVLSLMMIVNGWLTWRPIVIYNEQKMLGFRIFTIPIEDFFFGFALLGFNLVIWEFFNKREKKRINGK